MRGPILRGWAPSYAPVERGQGRGLAVLGAAAPLDAPAEPLEPLEPPEPCTVDVLLVVPTLVRGFAVPPPVLPLPYCVYPRPRTARPPVVPAVSDGGVTGRTTTGIP